VTFKDLQKLTTIQKNPNITKSSDFDIFKGLPFWIWSESEHKKQDILTKGQCCFNHVLGLPLKNNKEYPLFDYEKLIFDAIEQHQHTWIKKSRGIGATELILRYLAWKSLSSNILNNKSIFLVSGTREEFANGIKIRLERLFERKFPNIKFDSKYTELTLGANTWIKVFPTKRIQDLRGYTDVSYIFIDEADYFDPAEKWELEYVIKAYEEKSNCKIILTSTPNKPDSLFHKIERNEIFKGFFKKLFLDYTYGLGKIYDSDFIKREMNEAYFQREYCLAYAGMPSNWYSQQSIDFAVEAGKQYDPDQFRIQSPKFMAIDTGFSSSKFSILIGEWNSEFRQLRILCSELLDHPLYEDTISKIFQLRKHYGNVLNIGIDASNPELIASLKKKIGERYDYKYISEKQQYCKKYSSADISRMMIVVPVSFNTESKSIMTAHSKRMLDDPKRIVAINPCFNDLIVGLRGAIFDDRGHLDKDASPNDDVIDSYQILCQFFKYKNKELDENRALLLTQ
jgi:hypothetical protein